MSTLSLRRTAFIVVLAATLTTSWASAAEAKRATVPRAAGPAATGLVVRAWNLLTHLFGKEGCYIDPDGRCAARAAQPVQPRPTIDLGCEIDPDGRCAAGAVQAPSPKVDIDSGCYIDPNGHCSH